MCSAGGIGRRTRLKSERLRASEFESLVGDQIYTGVVERRDTVDLESTALNSVKVRILSPVPILSIIRQVERRLSAKQRCVGSIPTW